MGFPGGALGSIVAVALFLQFFPEMLRKQRIGQSKYRNPGLKKILI